MVETCRHHRDMKVLTHGSCKHQQWPGPSEDRGRDQELLPKQPTAEKTVFQPVSLGWPALAQGSLVGGKSAFLVMEDLSQLSDTPDRQRLGSAGSRA